MRGGRIIPWLAGISAVLLVVGGVLLATNDTESPRAEADGGRERLTPTAFHQRIFPDCSAMKSAHLDLLEVKSLIKLGRKLKDFGRSVDRMIERSGKLLPPLEVEDEFARYLDLLGDVVKPTRNVLAGPGKNLKAYSQALEDVAKAELRVRRAADAAGLFASCSLSSERESLDLLFVSRASLACLELSREANDALPKGVPTNEAEALQSFRVGATYSRRAAAAIRRAAPGDFEEPVVGQLARTFEEKAAVFDQLSAALSALNIGAYDAAVERAEELSGRANRLTRRLGLYACSPLAFTGN